MKRIPEMLAWATFFAFAAAVLGLRYGLLPQIERYRPEIVARVAATVGQPVKIGRIEAEWLGLRPQINLSDVRIYDAEGREALVLPAVENILSWRSLAHGQLRLHALRIEGPRLAVRRDSAGALYVAGMKLAPAAGGGGFRGRVLGPGGSGGREPGNRWRAAKRGTVRQATADLALAGVSAKLGDELPLLELGSISGRLQARHGPDGYQLTARKLALAPPGSAVLAPIDFQLAWKAESGVVSANTLELAPLAHFAEALPLPADVRRLALQLEPRGQLGDVRFEWQGAIPAPAQYPARAPLFDLGLNT